MFKYLTMNQSMIFKTVNNIFIIIPSFSLLISILFLSQTQCFYIFPNFAIIIIYYWTIYRPDLINVILIFFLGLIQDISTGLPIGFYSFEFLILYIITIKQRPFLVSKAFFTNWICFIPIALLIYLLEWVILQTIINKHIEIMPVFFSMLLTITIYPIITRILQSLHKILY